MEANQGQVDGPKDSLADRGADISGRFLQPMRRNHEVSL